MKNSTRKRRRREILRRLVCGLTFGPLMLCGASASAQATGGTVVAGAATIAQEGATLNVNTMSDRTIINWQGFSIGAGETANFIQPGANSAVLNRVTTPNNPSAIYGTLNSNGNVLLVNPSGIVVGPTGVINTNGFTASVLDIPDNEFLQGGTLRFRGDSTASVINEGKISTGSGGAALIGGDVINNGSITSDGGSISLVTGGSVTLADGSRFTHADMATIESGISPYVGVIQNSGTIRATGAIESGGEVYLVNPGGKLMHDGTIAARRGDAGGKVALSAKQSSATVTGSIDASGSVGGEVTIEAATVALNSASVTVAGTQQGGVAKIGGGFGGVDDVLQNATVTIVDQGSEIFAGSSLGEGGSVAIWGTDEVTFSGLIDTRGGEGGFAEVSTLGSGVVDGVALTGHFLIDPQDVCIATDAANCDPTLVAPVLIAPNTIRETLNVGGTFEINTTNPSGGGTGRVVFTNTVINVNNNTGTQGTFRILAADTIDSGDTQFQSVGTTGTNYEWFAGSSQGTSGTPVASADIIQGGQVINSGGGSILFDAADDVSINDPLLSGGGDITIIARGGDGGSVIQIGRSGNESDDRIDSTDGLGNAGAISLQTDELAINENAGSAAGGVIFADGVGGTVTVEPFTNGTQILLGSEDEGGLFLSNDLLSRIAAETLRVGNSDSGDITIGDELSPARISTLSLISGGSILNQNAGDTDITVDALALQASGGLDPLNVDVNTLAFKIGTGAVDITNAGSLTIGVVDGLAISSTSGSTTEIATTDDDSSITIDVNVSHSDDAEYTSDTISVGNSVVVSSDGSLALNADTVNLDGDLQAATGLSGMASTVNVQGSTGGAEIQDAVDVSTTGATVNVAAGNYAGFVVDVEDLTVDGAGETSVVNAASPAATIAANGVTLQDLLLQGTGAADEVGVLLDGTAAPNLTGAEIVNVDFSNLDDGVRSQGDIGDGVVANIDVTIRGNSSADKAVFQDFLDAAIDVGDTDGDAVYIVRDVVIEDGSDANSVSTGDDGMRFGSIGAATIQGVEISATGGDGIAFAAQSAAEILIGGADANSISGGDDGVDFLELNGSTVTLAGNTLLEGTGGLGDGLEFDELNEATVNIVGNTSILGTTEGVEFAGEINAGTINIAGNSLVDGASGDGILTVNALIDSDVIIGDAMVDVEGSTISFAGNGTIRGGADGLDIDSISGGTFTVRNNTLIEGSNDGIEFDDNLTDTTVTITGNTIAASSNGINFIDVIEGSTTVEIVENSIGSATTRVGAAGVRIEGGVTDTASVELGGSNEVFADELGIGVIGLQSELLITGGSYDGTTGGLEVDNTGETGDTGLVQLGDVTLTGGDGNPVVNVLTDTGGAGVGVEFAGNVVIDGGDTGLLLSGTETDIIDDTLGTLALTNQSGNYIELANGTEFAPGNPTIIDANDVTFDGVDPADMTPAELLATEDRIFHFPDDNTLGLIDIDPLFVVEGESIQLAVNAAGGLAGAQTVVVGEGTFGGSVEVWVDELTLLGTGDTTVIDTDSVDPFANNGDRNNGFEVVVQSFIAGIIGAVEDVVIEGFAFDTVSTSGNNDGIVLGQNAFRQAGNTTIQNNSFNDLDDGIVANAIFGTTTIAQNEMTDIDSQGIDIRPTLLFDDTIVVQDNVIESDQQSLRFFRSITGSDVTIQGNDFTSNDNDTIDFRQSVNLAEVTIGGTGVGEGNLLDADNRGIDFDSSVNGSSVLIAGNESIDGNTNAIRFDGNVSLSEIAIVSNDEIGAGGDSIFFDGNVQNSRIDIADNGVIFSDFSDAIFFDNPISDSIVNIGATLVDIGNGVQFFGGNDEISGDDDGINVDEIEDSLFTVTDNDLIEGIGGSAVEFEDTIDESIVVVAANGTLEGDEEGVEFDTDIQESIVVIAANEEILGGEVGILFQDDIVESVVSIGGFLPPLANGEISGDSAGIEFLAETEDSLVRIIGNEAITSDTDAIRWQTGSEITGDSIISIAANDEITGQQRGIEVRAEITDATVSIRNNRIEGVSSDAILFNEQMTDANITIGGPLPINGNEIFGGQDGLDIDAIDGGSFTIENNTIEADNDGIEFDDEISGDAVVQILNNQIDATNGIFQTTGSAIRDDAFLEIADNVINSDGEGVSLKNLDSSVAAVIRDTVVNGGDIGVAVRQTGEVIGGTVVVDGVVVNDVTDTGMLFANETVEGMLEVTLQNTVTINGGASPTDNGLVFDGPGLSLTGDTLADTKFRGQNGNYVELRNTALFEPGKPTLIDGTNADFDGLNADIPRERQQIIDKIVDFLDDNTLGLIFPGGRDLGESTYDRFTRYEDYFRTFLVLLEPNAGAIKYPAATIEVSEDLE